jgi:hypothetical protein
VGAKDGQAAGTGVHLASRWPSIEGKGEMSHGPFSGSRIRIGKRVISFDGAKVNIDD